MDKRVLSILALLAVALGVTGSTAEPSNTFDPIFVITTYDINLENPVEVKIKPEIADTAKQWPKTKQIALNPNLSNIGFYCFAGAIKIRGQNQAIGILECWRNGTVAVITSSCTQDIKDLMSLGSVNNDGKSKFFGHGAIYCKK